MKHVVVYVPGLGDSRLTGRRLMVAIWRLYGVRPVVHQMNWADKQPFNIKFQRLLLRIDELAATGNKVSLVGESAGASAALNAFAIRPDVIHRAVFVCGKLRHAETIHPYTYQRNPAFAESMRLLPASLKSLSQKRLERLRSIHPLWDQTVPVGDTLVDGVESKKIISVGHAPSIVLSDTLYSYAIIGFLKRD